MNNVSNISDSNSWNITRIAEAFGLHRETVRKRLRSSKVKPSGKRAGVDVYALADVGPALFSGERNVGDDDFLNPSKMLPKDRKDYFQSERERLKFEEEIGELIPDSDYRKDLYFSLSIVVNYFENLPDKMERTGLFTPEQLELLEKEGDKCRHEMYNKLIEITPDE
ncbi:DUF1441 family protein [Pseudoalteromonas umbrosa]|uniref:DUF1441 family protein n=1 Tax=Pseudoalteromonas umbrosa TaxID=3048489 RepID=UPI0024C2ABD7|nr:DUF1441 family protein [Pseudoalteromonas sp. B95]MDK1289791.1 DUF1441 family protein [Pseudoalteromonas sp. B95]